MVKEDKSSKKGALRRWEYRLVNGNSFEGLSFRMVFYGENGKVCGWTNEPIFMLADSKKQIKVSLVQAMLEIDDLLEASEKPIINESELNNSVNEIQL